MTRHLIFDMDKTIVDTIEIWAKAKGDLCVSLGFPATHEITREITGLNPYDLGRHFYNKLRPQNVTPEECGQRMHDFILRYKNIESNPMHGADAFLRLVSKSYILSVASGSPEELIRHLMNKFGWEGFFKVILSSETVKRGKPEPDVFLEAARLAHTVPKECIVFEDSLNGVKAAKNAGMVCFAIPSYTDPEIAKLADRTFASLAEITIEDVGSV
jgi:16S rRNA pseudouridine516 synthase